MGEGSGRGSGRVGSDFLSAIAGRVGSTFRRVGSGPRKVTCRQLCIRGGMNQLQLFKQKRFQFPPETVERENRFS